MEFGFDDDPYDRFGGRGGFGRDYMRMMYDREKSENEKKVYELHSNMKIDTNELMNEIGDMDKKYETMLNQQEKQIEFKEKQPIWFENIYEEIDLIKKKLQTVRGVGPYNNEVSKTQLLAQFEKLKDSVEYEANWKAVYNDMGRHNHIGEVTQEQLTNDVLAFYETKDTGSLRPEVKNAINSIGPKKYGYTGTLRLKETVEYLLKEWPKYEGKE